MPKSFSSLFRPKADRSGVQLTSTQAAFGTGGLALTATATVSVNVPVPNRKSKLLSLMIVSKTAAAGGSTITAQAFRRNNTGTPADVTLTAAKDLTATVFTVDDKSYTLAITAADKDCIFAVGDNLRIDIAAATTVTTAPQMVVVAEWGVLN